MTWHVSGNRAGALKVGLLGEFGTGNTGNDATAAVTVARLRSALPDIDLRLITTVEDTRPVAQAFGVDVVTLFRNRATWTRRGLARRVMRPWHAARDMVRTWAVARGVDVIVVGGGGVFEAEAVSGPSGWIAMAGLLALTVASSVGHHRIAFVGIGGTYLPTRAERGMLALSMRRADYRSFRDEGSLHAVEQMGGAGPSDHVTADLVFAVDLPVVPHPAQLAEEPASANPDAATERVVVDPSAPRSGRRIAMGVMGFAWIARDDQGISAADPYVQALAGATALLVEQGDEVVVFCGDTADRPVIDQVVNVARARLVHDNHGDLTAAVTSQLSVAFDDHLSEVNRADVVICSRFHNVVAAMLLERSTVAVADRIKVRDIMEHAGLGDYVLEARGLTSVELVRCIRRAQARQADIRVALDSTVVGARMRATHELDELVHLVGGWSGSPRATRHRDVPVVALAPEPTSVPEDVV